MSIHSARKREEKLEPLLESARASGSLSPDGKLTPAASALVCALWDPCVGTLHTLIRDGRIVSAGPLPISMHIEPADLEWLRVDYEERDYLCIELAVAGIRTFLRAAVDMKVWTPERSSMLTYFVNACLIHKLHVVNAWTKPRRLARKVQELASSDELDALTLDLSDVPYARDAAQLLAKHASPTVRRLLGALIQDQPITSAAADLGIAPATARTHLYRFRRNVVVPLIHDGLLDAPAGTAVAKHMASYDDDARDPQNTSNDSHQFDPFTDVYVPATVFSNDWNPTDVF